MGLLLDSAQVLNRFFRSHTATIRLFSPGMQGLLEGATESLVNRPYARVGEVCGANMLCPDLARSDSAFVFERGDIGFGIA